MSLPKSSSVESSGSSFWLSRAPLIGVHGDVTRDGQLERSAAGDFGRGRRRAGQAYGDDGRGTEGPERGEAMRPRSTPLFESTHGAFDASGRNRRPLGERRMLRSKRSVWGDVLSRWRSKVRPRAGRAATGRPLPWAAIQLPGSAEPPPFRARDRLGRARGGDREDVLRGRPHPGHDRDGRMPREQAVPDARPPPAASPRVDGTAEPQQTATARQAPRAAFVPSPGRFEPWLAGNVGGGHDTLAAFPSLLQIV